MLPETLLAVFLRLSRCRYPGTVAPAHRLVRHQRRPDFVKICATCSVLIWRQQKDGPRNRQATEALVTVLEGLRAVPRKSWQVQIAALRPSTEALQKGRTANQAADLYMTSSSELKESSFLVARQQRQVLEAGSAIEGVLSKINIYQPRFNFRIEGNILTMHDFAIKLGRGQQKPSDELKGLIVEVQYRPASNLTAARPILEAFIQILRDRTKTSLPGLREVPCPWAEYGLGDDFTPAHNAVQYASACAELMS